MTDEINGTNSSMLLTNAMINREFMLSTGAVFVICKADRTRSDHPNLRLIEAIYDHHTQKWKVLNLTVLYWRDTSRLHPINRPGTINADLTAPHSQFWNRGGL
jgi:hypothetical protein